MKALSRAAIERAAIDAAREASGAAPTEAAVARRALAAPSTLYGYFDNLDSIVAAAVVRLRRRFRASIWRPSSLQALAVAVADVVRENGDLAPLFFERTDATTIVPAPPNMAELLSAEVQRPVPREIARGVWTDTMGFFAHRWLSLQDADSLASEVERMAVPTLRLILMAVLDTEAAPRARPDIEALIAAVGDRLAEADSSGDAERRLLLAMWELLLDVGLDGVSIRELAARTGLGVGTVHRRLDRSRINAAIDQAMLDATLEWLHGRALQTGVGVVGALFEVLDEVDRARPTLMGYLLKPPSLEPNGFEQAIDFAITADATPEATAIWSGRYHSLVLGVWATRVLRAGQEAQRRAEALDHITTMLVLVTRWRLTRAEPGPGSIHLGGYASSLLPQRASRSDDEGVVDG